MVHHLSEGKAFVGLTDEYSTNATRLIDEMIEWCRGGKKVDAKSEKFLGSRDQWRQAAIATMTPNSGAARLGLIDMPRIHYQNCFVPWFRSIISRMAIVAAHYSSANSGADTTPAMTFSLSPIEYSESSAPASVVKQKRSHSRTSTSSDPLWRQRNYFRKANLWT